MKKYIIGFIVGLSTAATMAFALDYSDINWTGAHRNRAFKKAVIRVVEGNCSIVGESILC